MKRKKEALEEKILKEVEEDRTERKFWEVVNESRKRGGGISKLITDMEWLKHFIVQFGGEIEEPDGPGNEGRREFENKITEEELKKVVMKLKKGRHLGRTE